MGPDQPQLSEAYWLAPGLGCIFMGRNAGEKAPPGLILDNPNLRISEVRAAEPEFFGRFAGYYERDDGRIVFCQEAERHPQLDFTRHPVRLAGPFNQWGNGPSSDIWRLAPRQLPSGGVLWECALPRDLLSCGEKRPPFKFVSDDWQWLEVFARAPNRADDGTGNINYILDLQRSGTHVFRFRVEGGRGLDQPARIRLREVPHAPEIPVVPGLSFFDLASAAPLGATLEPRESTLPFWPRSDWTTFRLFAPRATRALLELFAEASHTESSLQPMSLLPDQLTWELQIQGDLHGRCYNFRVEGVNDGHTTHFDPARPLIDPYALATLGPEGPGIVITRDHPSRPDSDAGFEPPKIQDLVILEGHVRDLARRAPMDLGDEERLGFRGLTRWIAKDGSYLRELGFNALELLPVAQFDSVHSGHYHWGYMTTNYFSPCSHYTRSPHDAAQIAEFAVLVAECHRQGLAVILDVVYNHVGEPAFLLFIDKAYYFLLNRDGSLDNASGCGNTLRTESAMTRRLIIDSLLHMVRCYDVDGFRFDLAELITVEVLGEVEAALKAVKPSVLLIAEPWSFRGSIAPQLRSTGFAFWNDGYRDFMANYVRGAGNSEGLRYFMKGSLDHRCAWPGQSINYLQSHDDACWIDKITQREGRDGHDPTHNDLARTHLALAILLCSIGTPMLAQGLDFLHSKRGVSNTYLRSDLNELDYQRLRRFAHTHQYCRAWIRFRASSWGELIRLRERPAPGYLRLFTCPHSSAAALLFNADFSLGGRQILFAVNPHHDEIYLNLDQLPHNGWEELASRDHFHGKGHWSHHLNPHQRTLRLIPLDARLWVRHG
jgi:pullulanase/glycogen debranching enzyme